MRRAELFDAAESVIEAIHSSQLVDAFDRLIQVSRSERNDPDTNARLLNSLKQYTIKAHQFSPSARELVEILGLADIEDPALWARLMVPDESMREAFVLVQKTRFAVDSLPRIAKLIQPESLRLVESVAKAASSEHAAKAVLSVIVLEEAKRFSSPLRLINVLESVNLFYETCALMGGTSPQELSVIACDSGSDKSFDFLGAAKIIESVKELILALWDRVVFYREHKLDERLDLVAKSLPIIAQIKLLESEKTLEPEQAEIYRRNIFEASNKFIQSGATIPEVKQLHHDVRLLMSPVQKLLTSAPDDVHDANMVPPPIEPSGELKLAGLDLNNLSEDDKRKLQEILKRTQRDN